MNFWLQESERSLPMLSTDESGGGRSAGAGPGGSENINRQNDRFFRTALNYKNYGEKGRLTVFSGINNSRLAYRMENFVNGSGLVPAVESGSRVLSLDNRATYRYRISGRDELKADARYVHEAVQTNERVTGNSYDKSRGVITLGLSWFREITGRMRVRSTVTSQMVDKVAAPLSFSLGAEYHLLPSDRLYLKTSVSSNHHFPTLNDLYFQPGGNPNLRPEGSLSQELGLVFNRKGGAGGFSMDVTGYHARVNDWIIWLPSFKG